ncbi:MAG: DUF1573 domain-containing protein [Aureispira sp.]
MACENDSTPIDENPPVAPTTSVVTPEPEPLVEPDTIAVVEEVLDTTPKATRAERPVRIPANIAFKETSHNYDSIQQGEIVEYEFKFKNVGERPLTIKDVKGSCGCTIGSYPFLDIAPNEESSIKARFDSKGKVGPQFTTITVYSNAKPKGDVLSLKGVVIAPKETATETEEPKAE